MSPAPVKPFTSKALLKTAKMLLLPRLAAQTGEPWGASVGAVSNRDTEEGRENFVEVKLAPANRRSAMLAELSISTIGDQRIVTKYVGVLVVAGFERTRLDSQRSWQ